DRSLDDHPWLIRVSDAPVEQVQQHEDAQLPAVPADLVEELRALLGTRYPYLAATVAPSKQTATQRKGRVKDQEAAENAPAPKVESRQWRMPSFAGKQVLGRERGNALHAGMQYIRYEACTDTDAVAKELDRLVAERFLTAEQRVLVEEQKIAELFQTPLGRKLRSGVEVIREFKFSILDDGTAFDPALVGEKILLQGVVDCALLEPDGITVIDFKTDRVTEENVGQAVERYRPQVEAYAHALERIYGAPVKARYLYFFQLGRFMDI
ncbi:MAG: PD-(D/E)XK nuclease family protein, partial [Oscillospiraceae bacterium]|nr:PD-(D/E)XK nuclease family protein [Oscillospiraceae bacterium]